MTASAVGVTPGREGRSGARVPLQSIDCFSRKLICETDWTPPGLRESGEFSDTELARFWSLRRYPPGTRFPRYLAPFHAWEYDQDKVMRVVYELGLVARRSHASPVYSNYPINWLLMYSDLRHFGYNPYAPEFAALIRSGKANRLYWKFMAPAVDFMIRRRALLGRDVTRQMRWLGLGAGAEVWVLLHARPGGGAARRELRHESGAKRRCGESDVGALRERRFPKRERRGPASSRARSLNQNEARAAIGDAVGWPA